MAITTYTELKTAVTAWTHRGDMASYVDEFIDLAEADFNRRIRVRQNESRTSLTLASRSVALPADFLAVRSISSNDGELSYLTPSQFAIFDETGQIANVYTIVESNIKTRCEYTGITLAYWASLTGLSDAAPTNWLLTKAPNLYLAQTLHYAYLFTKDVNAAGVWQGKAEDGYARLLREDRQKTGPLQVRVGYGAVPGSGFSTSDTDPTYVE